MQSISSIYRADPPCLCFYREYITKFWTGDMAPTDEEEDYLLENGTPDFISWFRTKVPSNLPLFNFEIPL